MQDLTLQSRRLIKDYLNDVGGVMNVEVSKEMIKSVYMASFRYKDHLEKCREDERQKSKKRVREEGSEEIEALKKKLKTLSNSISGLNASADAKAQQAESKQSFQLLTESNALRLAAKAKNKEVETVQTLIDQKVNHQGSL